MNVLYYHNYENEMGEKKRKGLCWDCDFDIINGRGDFDDDAGEVAMRHEEEEYEDDPVNNPRPTWMGGY